MRPGRTTLVTAVIASSAFPFTAWLPWSTVGGHEWTARRLLREGVLLGLLGGGALVVAVVVMTVVSTSLAIAMVSTIRRREPRAALATFVVSAVALAAGVIGLLRGDGGGPIAAAALGVLGLASSVVALGATRAALVERSDPATKMTARSGWPTTTLGLLIALLGPLQGLLLVRGPAHNTPAEAMLQVVRAIDERDPVALAEITSPDERSILLDDGIPLLRELRRVGLVSLSSDLRRMRGTSSAMTDVRTSVADLAPGVAAVRVTRARIVPPAAPSDLPLLTWWPRLRAIVLGGTPAYPSSWASVADELPAVVDAPPLVFRRQHGHWYLSLVRTLSAAAGLTDGRARPRRTDATGGASSPRDAVEELALAIARLDVDTASRLLAPGEVGALVEDDAVRRSLHRLLDPIAKEYALELPGIETRVRRRGATAWVRVVRTGVDLRTTATDAPPFRVRYDLDTRCTTATLDQQVWTRCGRAAWRLFDDLAIPVRERDVRELIGQHRKGATAQAFVVVRRGGRWYVSPARTLLRALTVRVREMSDTDAASSVRTVREILDALRS